MSGFGQAYFYVCGVMAILGALGVVLARNPIRGAMALLGMIVSIAGLFLALHAQFLAAIQLIVYAGAIVVLFLFVIMMLGPSVDPPADHRGRVGRVIGGTLFAAAGLGAIGILVRTAPKVEEFVPLPNAANDFGSIDAFGKLLFSQGLVPFELSSALLMVAIVGAVAVARGRSKHDRVHEPDEKEVVS